jgi:P-type E1-E2 ATPase
MGDLVRIQKDTEFPADLLLVGAQKDLVFVDTMNLDGETNLKERMIPFENDSYTLSGHVACDLPNSSLEDWNGNVTSK